MKKIFIFLLMMFLMFSCKTHQNVDEITFGSSMRNSYTMSITQSQLDSICDADTLPVLDRWVAVRFTDYETNKVYIKRMCRKNVNNIEYMYILTENGKKYKITRRITE